jgi:alpha-L-rhamnosidase
LDVRGLNLRYVQVDGWPGDDPQALREQIEAVTCSTDMRLIGEFTCSDVLLNKLYENVIRSMRGNLLSVPTDCPQRDERLGWTGDITLFGPTAAYLSDCYGKLSRWLGDVAVD